MIIGTRYGHDTWVGVPSTYHLIIISDEVFRPDLEAKFRFWTDVLDFHDCPVLKDEPDTLGTYRAIELKQVAH